MMFRRILIPVDGSRHARRAVQVAADLAGHYQSTVFVLHVIRDLSLPEEILEMIRAGEVTKSRMEILQDSADIILDNAKTQLNQAGILDVQIACELGDPAAVIAEYTTGHDIDLIVLGHHGLGPHDGLLGGVTRKLLNLAQAACMIVP